MGKLYIVLKIATNLRQLMTFTKTISKFALTFTFSQHFTSTKTKELPKDGHSDSYQNQDVKH